MIDQHKYFDNASFGKSRAFLTDDKCSIYHTWNVQFKHIHNPHVKLFGPHHTIEEIADKFGEFMKAEFIKAVKNEDARKQREWDEGEKTSTVDLNGNITTSLIDEKPSEYHDIKGQFTPIG